MPRGRIHQARLRWANRLHIHVAGRPMLRRGGNNIMKSLGMGFGYAALVEPRWIQRTLIELTVKNLPASLDGYRIVHLSDIHHNFMTGRMMLDRVVDLANGLDPDLVALTGDFVTHNSRRLWSCMEILSSLRAPDGLYATRGNHDYRIPIETWRHVCDSVGITLLENEHSLVNPVRHRGTMLGHAGPHPVQLVVAGVADLWEGKVEIARALEGAPSDVPRIMLSHNPLVAEVVTPHHNIALMLSGHTHGGQIRPFGRTVALLAGGSAKYGSGLVQAPDTTVYISRGVGTSAMYARWNCRPEIALIVLRAE